MRARSLTVARAACSRVVCSGFVVLLFACDAGGGFSPRDAQQPNPLSVDYPVAYVERPLVASVDLRDPSSFQGAARIVLKERAAASVAGTAITAGLVAGDYDVKDLTVSPSGRKLAFALRTDPATGPSTWNLWQYDLDTQARPRRLLGSDTRADAGHDISPRYLDEHRLVFSSTRQVRSQQILAAEGRQAFTALDEQHLGPGFSLHVLDTRKNSIEQITFNPSHDLAPAVLDDGRIVYLRWDALAQHDQLSLYRVNPDGTGAELYYGFHSQLTGTDQTEATFAAPFPLGDGRLAVNLRPRVGSEFGGDLVAIDAQNFTELDQPVRNNAGASGPAQTSLAAGSVDTTGQTVSPGGNYSSLYPLGEDNKRLLVSWSPCRLLTAGDAEARPCTPALLNQEGVQPAPPLFGLWIYDSANQTQMPVQVPPEGTMYTDAVVLAPRPAQVVWQPETTPLPDSVAEAAGVLHIRSVYDLDGVDTAPEGLLTLADPNQTQVEARPIRFLRLVKQVPLPVDDSVVPQVIGPAGFMREILGYVPVEPDGSVKVKIPADVAFSFDLLDADGLRINPRHDIWLSLRAGEERNCRGCHSTASLQPHGREEAQAPSSNFGAVGGEPFPNSRLADAVILPEQGQTMAEYYAAAIGVRAPTMDLTFADEWTNSERGAALGDPIHLRYQAIEAAINNTPSNCQPLEVEAPQWSPPTECTTANSWNASCRTVINYRQHIQPLWQADRRQCDEFGNQVADATCVSCHNPTQPAANLVLTGDLSRAHEPFVTSYAQLFDLSQADDEQDTVTGAVQSGPNAVLSVEGARASGRFFALFANNASHQGRLSADELRLLAEWLDIGGQYYNTPFPVGPTQ